jgi:hypothetical protein
MEFLSTFRFSSPAMATVVLLPLIVIAYQYYFPRKRGTVAVTDLEYLLQTDCIGAGNPKRTKTVLQFLVLLGLAVIWAGPEYSSSEPLFEEGAPQSIKKYVIALDISPSMNLPYDVTGYGEDDLKAGEEGVTRFELARQALVNFLERFRGHQFGLVVFSTEPLLARWPTTDTENNFAEVLESIRRGSGTQLSAFSSLTNIDKGLSLARKAAGDSEAAIILISDAEDHLENIGAAVSELRQSGLRLYIIGVGISEQVIGSLSEQFSDDPGFQIFRATSEEEMEKAYETLGAAEQSPLIDGTERIHQVDLEWMFALIIALLSAALFWAGESHFHTTFAGDRDETAGSRGGHDL